MHFVGMRFNSVVGIILGLISKLLSDFSYVVTFLGYLIFLNLCNCSFLSILLHKRITYFVICETG